MAGDQSVVSQRGVELDAKIDLGRLRYFDMHEVVALWGMGTD